MAVITTYHLLIALIIGTGGFSYGFGSTAFVTTIGLPGFYVYFALDPASDCEF